MYSANDCRDRASACQRLAEQAIDPVIERSYLSLVNSWRIFAVGLEERERNERHSVVQSIECGVSRVRNNARPAIQFSSTTSAIDNIAKSARVQPGAATLLVNGRC